MSDSTGAEPQGSAPLAHLKAISALPVERGYQGPAGVFIHKDELTELFNLLEANPHKWNRRLRVVLAGYILYLISEGILDGAMVAEEIQVNRSRPGR